MDKILVRNINGKEVEVEMILTVSKNNKNYLLYKDNNEIYASYIYVNDDNNVLHNDLTEDEYLMLEDIYKKGIELYDK